MLGIKPMSVKILTTFIALVFVSTISLASENETTEEDIKVLALVLKRSYPDGGYTVVSPATGFIFTDSQGIKHRKKFIMEHLKPPNDIAISRLIDQLSERNEKSVRLSLRSSPENGYLIDYEGKYSKYFKENGGGWKKWYEENPEAHGMTVVSLPAYNKKLQLVLVFLGNLSDELAGKGCVILYRFKNGALTELATVVLWYV